MRWWRRPLTFVAPAVAMACHHPAPPPLAPIPAPGAGTGTLIGVVTDAAERPVLYARVQLLATPRVGTSDEPQRVAIDNTGRTGYFAFRGVAPGQYVVRAGFIGFRTSTDTVHLLNGRVDSLRIHLHASTAQCGDRPC